MAGGLQGEVRRLVDDLSRAYPNPAPYTTESTVLERLRGALNPIDSDCDACGAEPGEPCRWPCTAHAEALELDAE